MDYAIAVTLMESQTRLNPEVMPFTEYFISIKPCLIKVAVRDLERILHDGGSSLKLGGTITATTAYDEINNHETPFSRTARQNRWTRVDVAIWRMAE